MRQWNRPVAHSLDEGTEPDTVTWHCLTPTSLPLALLFSPPPPFRRLAWHSLFPLYGDLLSSFLLLLNSSLSYLVSLYYIALFFILCLQWHS